MRLFARLAFHIFFPLILASFSICSAQAQTTARESESARLETGTSIPSDLTEGVRQRYTEA